VRTDGRALGKISNPDCVVVWNHGRTQGGEDWSASIMPFYTNKLKDLGCDMYRLNRLSAFDNPPALSANALANVANKLHGAGYEKVILAGQSWGALISVIAAGISRNVYAVIATAPAAFGPRTNNPNDGWPQNSSVLYSYLWATNPQTRMFLFFPKDDAFDPLDGRGKNVQDILAQRNIASVVVNYPPNFPGGHNIAVSQNFADRFGICIQDFVQMKNIGVNSQCTQNGLEPKGRVEPPTIASRPPQAEGRIIRVSTPAQ
jgi:pimeloyl-ACP methyl ester carboxylesterase